MMHLYRIATLAAGGVTLLAVLAGVSSAAAGSSAPEAQRLNDILERTAGRTSAFVDQFSDVKCTEQVRQEKLGKDNKVELKEESTYDYLVIMSNTGGELNLSESRIPVHEAKKDRKNTSMLLSNGFATLFLVFHPIYAGAFKFTLGWPGCHRGPYRRKDHLPAHNWHEVTRSPGSARPGISVGTHGNGLDRS